MAGKTLEARPAQSVKTEPYVPDARKTVLDPEGNVISEPESTVATNQDTNRRSNKERFARGYRALSVGSVPVYAALGVAVSPIFFAAAGWNVVEAGVSHKYIKNQEKKRLKNLEKQNIRLDKQHIIEAQNGQNISNVEGKPATFPDYDISPTDRYPRTRQSRRSINAKAQQRV